MLLLNVVVEEGKFFKRGNIFFSRQGCVCVVHAFFTKRREVLQKSNYLDMWVIFIYTYYIYACIYIIKLLENPWTVHITFIESVNAGFRPTCAYRVLACGGA